MGDVVAVDVGCVPVAVGVAVNVDVGCVPVAVGVSVNVDVGCVPVAVGVSVNVDVGCVPVAVGVSVNVDVGDPVGVSVDVGVGVIVPSSIIVRVAAPVDGRLVRRLSPLEIRAVHSIAALPGLQTFGAKSKGSSAGGGFIAIAAGDRDDETSILRIIDRYGRIGAKQIGRSDIADLHQSCEL